MCAFVWYWPYLGKVARYTQNLNDFWTLDKIPGQPNTHGVWACPSKITPQVGYSYVYNEYLSNARKGSFQHPLFSANRVHQGDIIDAADVYIHGDETPFVHGNGRNFLLADSHVEFVYEDDPQPIIYPE
jgi:prepilin-type processing-associated H-X9-DG protein